ncbi:hypothetical protein OAS86_04125 [Gammaproteobacteria bacterium]|nr:hypothetical protein [Gammaproteobacteria bacterium]
MHPSIHRDWLAVAVTLSAITWHAIALADVKIMHRALLAASESRTPDATLEIKGESITGDPIWRVKDNADAVALEVDSNGRVGVATATPANTLEVAASGGVSGLVTSDFSPAATPDAALLGVDASGTVVVADVASNLTMQAGRRAVTTTSGQWSNYTVVFPTAFASGSTPKVFITLVDNLAHGGGEKITTIKLFPPLTDNTQFTFYVRDSEPTSGIAGFDWIAVGQP